MRQSYRQYLTSSLAEPQQPDDAFMAPDDCANVEQAILQGELKCTAGQAKWLLTQVYAANEKDADAASQAVAQGYTRRAGRPASGRGGGRAGGGASGRAPGARASGGDGADGDGAAAETDEIAVAAA